MERHSGDTDDGAGAQTPALSQRSLSDAVAAPALKDTDEQPQAEHSHGAESDGGDAVAGGIQIIQEDGDEDEDELMVQQSQQQRAREDDAAETVFLPQWIKTSFPLVTSESELQQQQPHESIEEPQQQQRAWPLCDECCSRDPVFHCSQCDQRLCFKCTDAIHIIPALADHTIARLQQEDVADLLSPSHAASSIVAEASESSYGVAELPPAAPIVSPRAFAASPGVPASLRHLNPTTQVESRLALPIGTRVFFRSVDGCGRWTRELLHGTVIQDDGVRANAKSTFFYRLVWLRGVHVLPNGFFRASLELNSSANHDSQSTASTSSSSKDSYWPQEIGIFPTQLSAFRAVVTAEAIARMKFRREQISGRLGIVDDDFPSTQVLGEILEETDAILGAEFKVRLSKQDDTRFLVEVGRGKWDYRAWMKSIGRDEQLREEDATSLAAASHPGARRNRSSPSAIAIPMPWQPASRMRFFLAEQSELLFPEQEQKTHLASIMAQMLNVYIGFAWTRWRKFVKRSRHHELLQRRHHGAARIQNWLRRLTQQWEANAAVSNSNQDASLQALLLHQRCQAAAARLHAFMTQQLRAKQRAALQRLAAITRIHDPDVRRHFEICEQTRWHPSYGITTLPKLPKVYAHKRNDGSVAIDDVKLYKQFRANHVGPTDMSYWVVRGRVLAGVYPIGKSFRDARRIVARADYTTSVLLQEVSVYVCLATSAELEAFESVHVKPTLSCVSAEVKPQLSAVKAMAAASAFVKRSNNNNKHTGNAKSVHMKETQQKVSPSGGHSVQQQTPWMFERVVRNKYDALQIELRAAVKMNARQVQLAQAELDDNTLASAPPAAAAARASTPAPEDPAVRETLTNKLVLAQQNAAKAQKALDTLTMELQFVHFPIAKDSVPESEQLESFLLHIEDLLRAKRNVYVFSMNGHGRTGFVAALLLGRLYGIPSLEALERAQRLHDCQWSMHSVPSNRSTSSPKAAVQITAVQRLLAHWDAIYAPITTTSEASASSKEPQHGVYFWRAQQRGLVVDPFMKKDGFMISETPDASSASRQLQELRKLQRIAMRESAAAQLVRQRQRESAAQQAMVLEDGLSRQLQRQASRRASIVIMELAMVGAATAAVDDLVRAVELQASRGHHHPAAEDGDEATAARAIEDAVESLVHQVAELQQT